MRQTDMSTHHTCSCGDADHATDPTPSPTLVKDVGHVNLTADQADALAAVWTVLARVLAEPPTADALDALRSEELLQEWPLLDTPRTTADDLTVALESLAESRRAGEDAAAVSDDHMHLVKGPRSPLAYPFESVHRSREGLVFERETLQVRGWYSRFGLQAPRLDRDPDDRIDLELEFCSTLLRRGLEALDRGDANASEMLFTAHRDFCREHLLMWAPAFFGQLLTGASTHFYRGMARLGRHAACRRAKRTPEQRGAAHPSLCLQRS